MEKAGSHSHNLHTVSVMPVTPPENEETEVNNNQSWSDYIFSGASSACATVLSGAKAAGSALLSGGKALGSAALNQSYVKPIVTTAINKVDEKIAQTTAEVEKEKMGKLLDNTEAASIVEAFLRQFGDKAINKALKEYFPEGTPKGFEELIIYNIANNLIKKGMDKYGEGANGQERVKNGVNLILEPFNDVLMQLQDDQALLADMTPEARKKVLIEGLQPAVDKAVDIAFPGDIAWTPIQKIIDSALYVLNSQYVPDFGFINGIKTAINAEVLNVALDYAEEAFSHKKEKVNPKLLLNADEAESIIGKFLGTLAPVLRSQLKGQENSSDLSQAAVDRLNKENKAALGSPAADFIRDVLQELAQTETPKDNLSMPFALAGAKIEEVVQHFFIQLAKNSEKNRPTQKNPQDFFITGVFSAIAACAPELEKLKLHEEDFSIQCKEYLDLKEKYRKARDSAMQNSSKEGGWMESIPYIKAKQAFKKKQDEMIKLFRPTAEELLIRGGMIDKDTKKPKAGALPLPASEAEDITNLLKDEGIPYMLLRFAVDIIHTPHVEGSENLRNKEDLTDFAKKLSNVALPEAKKWLSKEETRKTISETMSQALKGHPLTNGEKAVVESWIKTLVEDTTTMEPTVWVAVRSLLPSLVQQALTNLAVKGVHGKEGDALHGALSEATRSAMSVVDQMQQRWKKQLNLIESDPSISREQKEEIKRAIKEQRAQFKKDVRRWSDLGAATSPEEVKERENLKKIIFNQAFAPHALIGDLLQLVDSYASSKSKAIDINKKNITIIKQGLEHEELEKFKNNMRERIIKTYLTYPEERLITFKEAEKELLTLFKEMEAENGDKIAKNYQTQGLHYPLLADCGYKSASALPVPFVIKEEVWQALNNEIIPQQLLQLYHDIALGEKKSEKQLDPEGKKEFKQALHDLSFKANLAARAYYSDPKNEESLKKLVQQIHGKVPGDLLSEKQMQEEAKALLQDDTHPMWRVIDHYITSYAKEIITETVGAENGAIPEKANLFAALANKITPAISTYVMNHRNDLQKGDDKAAKAFYAGMIKEVLAQLHMDEAGQARLPAAVREEIFTTLVEEVVPTELQGLLSGIFSMEGDRDKFIQLLAENTSKSADQTALNEQKKSIATIGNWGGNFVADFIQKYLKEQKNSDELAEVANMILKDISSNKVSFENDTISYLSNALVGLNEGTFNKDVKDFISSLTQAITAAAINNLIGNVKAEKGEEFNKELLPADCLIYLTKMISDRKTQLMEACEQDIENINSGKMLIPEGLTKEKGIEKALQEHFKPLVNDLLKKLLPEGRDIQKQAWDYLESTFLPNLAAKIYLDMRSWTQNKAPEGSENLENKEKLSNFAQKLVSFGLPLAEEWLTKEETAEMISKEISLALKDHPLTGEEKVMMQGLIKALPTLSPAAQPLLPPIIEQALTHLAVKGLDGKEGDALHGALTQATRSAMSVIDQMQQRWKKQINTIEADRAISNEKKKEIITKIKEQRTQFKDDLRKWRASIASPQEHEELQKKIISQAFAPHALIGDLLQLADNYAKDKTKEIKTNKKNLIETKKNAELAKLEIFHKGMKKKIIEMYLSPEPNDRFTEFEDIEKELLTLFKEMEAGNGRGYQTESLYFSLLADCGYTDASKLPAPFIKEEIWQTLNNKIIPKALLHIYSDIAVGEKKSEKQLDPEGKKEFKQALHDLSFKANLAARAYYSDPKNEESLEKLVQQIHGKVPGNLLNEKQIKEETKALLQDTAHPMWRVIDHYITSYAKEIITETVGAENGVTPEKTNLFAALANKITPAISTYIMKHRDDLQKGDDKAAKAFYAGMIKEVLRELHMDEAGQARLPAAVREEIFTTLVEQVVPTELQGLLSGIFSMESDRDKFIELLAKNTCKKDDIDAEQKRKEAIAAIGEWGGGFVADFIENYLKEQKNSDELAEVANTILKNISANGVSLEKDTVAYLSSALIGLDERTFNDDVKTFISSLTQAIAGAALSNLIKNVATEKGEEFDKNLLPADCLIRLAKMVSDRKAELTKACEEEIKKINRGEIRIEEGLTRAEGTEKALQKHFKPLVSDLLKEALPEGKAIQKEAWDYLENTFLPNLAAQIYLDLSRLARDKAAMKTTMEEIFDKKPLWTNPGNKPLHSPMRTCEELAKWAVEKLLPSNLKNEDFINGLVDSFYDKLPEAVKEDVTKEDLQNFANNNAKKLAEKGASSPLELFQSELTTYVESIIMKSMIGGVGTIKEIENWYEKHSDAKTPLEKNLLYQITAESMREVRKNLEEINKVTKRDKRNFNEITKEELISELEKSATPPALLKPDMENFYKPLAAQLWHIVNHHGPKTEGALEALPIPRQVKELLKTEVSKNILPHMLESIFTSELDDKQLNKRMFKGIELIMDGLVNCKDSRLPTEEELEVDPKLYEDCGNLILDLAESMPQFGLKYLLSFLPVAKHASAKMVGAIIVRNLGKANTTALIQQILGSIDPTVDLVGDTKEISDKMLALKLTELKASVAKMILPALAQRWTNKVEEFTNKILTKITTRFPRIGNFARAITEWIDKTLSTIFHALISIVQIVTQPIYGGITWFLGKLYLNKRSLHDIQFARTYAQIFGLGHIQSVIKRYDDELTNMEKKAVARHSNVES